MKRFFITFSVIFTILVMTLNHSAEVKAEEQGKIIYIVYDNSVSMIKDEKGKERDWGAQAQYAVKAFCAMSDPEDEIRFYRIGDFNESYKRVTSGQEDINLIENASTSIKKTEDQEENRQSYSEEIEGIKFDGQRTYYTGMHQAISDMKERSGERWIIMFTDGDIEDCNGPEFSNYLHEDLNNTGINVCFVDLNQGDAKDPVYSNDYYNLTVYRLGENGNDSIIDSILAVTEQIYGKRKLPEGRVDENNVQDGERTLSLNFDIPVSNVVLLIQSEQDLRGRTQLDNCQWSFDIIGTQNEKEMGPYGIAAEYTIGTSEYQNKDDYSMPIVIPEEASCAVYYTPMGEAALTVEQEAEGVKAGTYLEGKYSVYIDMLNPATGEPVNRDAELLQREKGILTIDGIDEKVSLGMENVKTAETGIKEIRGSTPLGDTETREIQFEEDMEKYELRVTTDERIFYYNRLEEQENAVLISIMENDVNVSEKFKDLQPQIEYWQGGQECKEMDYDPKYDLEYDSENAVWRVYPRLKNPKEREISGNLVCRVKFEKETSYYKEPIEYSEEIELQMSVEEDLFQIEIKEDTISPFRLLVPVLSNVIPVDFEWNGEKLKKSEVDDFTAVIAIIDDKETVEKEINDNPIRIWGNIENFWNQTSEIQIRAEASYTAYGITEKKNAVRTIDIEKIPGWKKLIAGLVMMLTVTAVIILICDAIRIWQWVVTGKILLKAPYVSSCFSDRENWMSQKRAAKKKWKRRIGIILYDFYYEIHIQLPRNCGFPNLVLELRCKRDDWKIRIGGANLKWDLKVAGEAIEREFKTLIPDTEMVLKVPKHTLKIKIRQGEEG